MSGSSSTGKGSKSAALARTGGGDGKGLRKLKGSKPFTPQGGHLVNAVRQAARNAKHTLGRSTRNNPKR